LQAKACPNSWNTFTSTKLRYSSGRLLIRSCLLKMLLPSASALSKSAMTKYPPTVAAQASRISPVHDQTHRTSGRAQSRNRSGSYRGMRMNRKLRT